MSVQIPTRRVVLTLLQQNGGSLTVSIHDPSLSALHRRLQDLVSHGRVELAARSASTITYCLRQQSLMLPTKFQPSDANA